MKRVFIGIFALVLLLVSVSASGCAREANENTRDVAILMYHDFIQDGEPGDFEITAERFEEQIKALSDAGYVGVDFTDLINFVNGDGELPEKCVIISTDDGYTGVIDVALPICEKYGMKLTCAVIGGKVEQYNHFMPDESMVGRIELTSHTYALHTTHADGYNGVNLPLTGEPLRDQLSADAQKMLEEYGDLFPEMGKIIVYPFGAHTAETDRIFADLGYDVSVTVEWGCATVEKGKPDSLRCLPRYQVYPNLTGEDIVKIAGKK